MTDEELRALAEKATPNKWSAFNDYNVEIGVHDITGVVCRMMVTDEYGGDRYTAERAVADARFIAAANPATVLSLLSRLSRAEQVCAAATRVVDRWRKHGTTASDTRALIDAVDSRAALNAAVDQHRAAKEGGNG